MPAQCKLLVFDDPAFWRDQARGHEAAGDVSGAVLYWQAAIAAARRQPAHLGTPADLRWLHSRLARARSVEELADANTAPAVLH
nr:hypothetical protein [uncultured Lichenicoccus sp.]